MKHSPFSQISQLIFGLYCFITSVVFIPVLVLRMLSLPTRILKYLPPDASDKSLFKTHFEAFYADLDTKKSFSSIFTVIFIYRRLLMVIAILFMHQTLELSFVILTYTNAMINIYLLKVQPKDQASKNRVEMVNEYLTFVVCALMSQLTNYTFSYPNRFLIEEVLEYREIIGWVIIFIIFLTIMINLIMFVMQLYKKCKPGIIKKYAELKEKCKKKKETPPNESLDSISSSASSIIASPIPEVVKKPKEGYLEEHQDENQENFKNFRPEWIDSLVKKYITEEMKQKIETARKANLTNIKEEVKEESIDSSNSISESD